MLSIVCLAATAGALMFCVGDGGVGILMNMLCDIEGAGAGIGFSIEVAILHKVGIGDFAVRFTTGRIEPVVLCREFAQVLVAGVGKVHKLAAGDVEFGELTSVFDISFKFSAGDLQSAV